MTVALSIAIALTPLIVATLAPFRRWQAAGPAIPLRSASPGAHPRGEAAGGEDVEAAVRAHLYGDIGGGPHR